jgi:hypothetical protein
MGVDSTAILVFGWSIEYEKILKFLQDNNVGSCCDYQCFCGESCWDLSKLPQGCYIIQAHPYFDCKADECIYYVSLINPNKSISLKEINEIKITEELKQFAISMGADDCEPVFDALVNIW